MSSRTDPSLEELVLKLEAIKTALEKVAQEIASFLEKMKD